MTLLTHREIAAELGGYSAEYVRQIAADQGRRPEERRFPQHIHEGWPVFRKHGRKWVVTYQQWVAFRTRFTTERF